MALTEQQAAAIERLRGNESLTGNLTDRPAMAVLAWAEEQIQANALYDDVVAAVRSANRTGTEDADEALAAARKSLSAAQVARGVPASEPPAAAIPAPPPPAPPTSAPPVAPAPPSPSAASPQSGSPPSSAPPVEGRRKNTSKRKSNAHRQ